MNIIATALAATIATSAHAASVAGFGNGPDGPSVLKFEELTGDPSPTTGLYEVAKLTHINKQTIGQGQTYAPIEFWHSIYGSIEVQLTTTTDVPFGGIPDFALVTRDFDAGYGLLNSGLRLDAPENGETTAIWFDRATNPALVPLPAAGGLLGLALGGLVMVRRRA